MLRTPVLKAVFWGSEWNDPAFAGDIISGLDTLLTGYAGSRYASTLAEYYDRTGPISGYSIYAGHTIDASPAPAAGGLTSALTLARVCAATGNNPDPNTVLHVYLHAEGRRCAGRHVQLSCERYLHKREGIASRRRAVRIRRHRNGLSRRAGYGNWRCSLALAQMANLTMHELAETITDPRNNGWSDAYHTEIGNKCILTFPLDRSGT